MHRRDVLSGALACLFPTAVLASVSGFYIAENGVVLGPFDETALKDRIKSVSEARNVMVWQQGMDDWMPASDVPALQGFVASLPAETPIDFEAFVIGKWLCDDYPFRVKVPKKRAVTLIGRREITFKKDGTYSGLDYAQFIDRGWVAGIKPGELRPYDESIILHDVSKGKYSFAESDQEGHHRINLEGKVEAVAGNNAGDIDNQKVFVLFSVLGTDRMRTSEGQDFSRIF